MLSSFGPLHSETIPIMHRLYIRNLLKRLHTCNLKETHATYILKKKKYIFVQTGIERTCGRTSDVKKVQSECRSDQGDGVYHVFAGDYS